MKKKPAAAQRIVVELKLSDIAEALGGTPVCSHTVRELNAEKQLRNLLYHARDMVKQLDRPTADYAICLHNLRGYIAELDRKCR